MAKINLFIAGTDTDIGKTYTSLQLLQACQRWGLSSIALKPLASGCDLTEQGLRNSDALQLLQAASIKQSYEKVNSIALKEPVSPHIAAEQAGIPLSVNSLLQAVLPSFSVPADVLIIESCGGWLCPLNRNETMADFACALNIPIILVVGMRVGCLNHSLLTLQALKEQKAFLGGWIANIIDPNMLYFEENILTLSDYFSAPPLAIIPYAMPHKQDPLDQLETLR